MPPRPGTLRNRWAAYAGVSTVLAAGVVLKSLAQRPNFYSAAVYLSQSSANLMILCNLVFVSACSLLLFLQQSLYGPLRPIEIEQLYEKAWFAVTETCLAMTIFRGEIGPWFLVMFFSLLVGKVWGWIGEGRVEVLEQQQQNIIGGPNARLFHTSLILSLGLSVIFDLIMLNYIVAQVLHMARPDMMVMFGFEFAVLSVSSTSTALRYALNVLESNIVQHQKQQKIASLRKERIEAALRELDTQQTEGTDVSAASSNEERRRDAETAAAAQPIDDSDVEVEGWESKGRYMFYLDLITDFCKLCIYLSFFIILLVFYGLPLHIMRDVFLTCRSFFKRIGDFVRYRNATRDMNQRYPDATDAEILREDVCIICREDMRPYVPPAPGVAADPVAERLRPKKLPCGHILHFACLRSWLERQQICPTCRAAVVSTQQNQQPAAGARGANRQQHPQDPVNPRARVYQLGPLRIGVGAVRGNDLFEQLDQQIANPNPPLPEHQNANVPQQFGFGIRWGGPRRRHQTTTRQPRGQIEDQLRSVERQMQREADSLQSSMGELQALRNIQAQLSRIRMARDAAAQAGQTNHSASVQTGPQLDLSGINRPVSVTALRSASGQNILQANSDQLPAGLVLPEGWSLMPLQPMAGQVQQFPVHFPGMINGQMPAMGIPNNAQQIPPPVTQTVVQPRNTGNTQADAVQPPTAPPSNHTTNTTQTTLPSVVATSASNINHGNSIASRSGLTGGQRLTQSQPAERNTVSTTPRPADLSTAGTSAIQPPLHRTVPSGQTTQTSQPPPMAISGAATSSSSLQPTRANVTRLSSSHRPARSIGSSWGFSKTNDDDDDADDDEEDSSDDEEKDDGHSAGEKQMKQMVAKSDSSDNESQPSDQSDVPPRRADTSRRSKAATVEEPEEDSD